VKCPNCGQPMQEMEGVPASYDEPAQPPEWWCECGHTELVNPPRPAAAADAEASRESPGVS